MKKTKGIISTSKSPFEKSMDKKFCFGFKWGGYK